MGRRQEQKICWFKVAVIDSPPGIVEDRHM
jgi:hypothetical protein